MVLQLDSYSLSLLAMSTVDTSSTCLWDIYISFCVSLVVGSVWLFVIMFVQLCVNYIVIDAVDRFMS